MEGAAEEAPEPTDPRFAAATKFVLGWEGGFVDDPADRGGRTNKGVTFKAYDSWRDKKKLPRQDVKLITDQEVRQLYFEDYWLASKCDRMRDPSDLLQFDTAVNMGPGRAVRFLQHAVGVKVDGGFGDDTKAACASCDMGELLTRYCDKREQFYRELARTDPSQERFLRGWLNRLNALRRHIGLSPGKESLDETLEGNIEPTAKAGDLEPWEDEIFWESPDGAEVLELVESSGEAGWG